MRFSSMEDAIRYVRVNNIGDLPVIEWIGKRIIKHLHDNESILK